MAKQENNPTSIGLTQYLDPSYWTWAAEDPNGAALLQQGAEAILAYVVQRLEATGCQVVEAYGIVHDKDEREDPRSRALGESEWPAGFLR